MPAVHTTGINWEQIAAFTVVAGAILGMIGRYVGRMIRDAIDQFRHEVVGQLDNRLTSVENDVKLIKAIVEKRRRLCHLH